MCFFRIFLYKINKNLNLHFKEKYKLSAILIKKKVNKFTVHVFLKKINSTKICNI